MNPADLRLPRKRARVNGAEMYYVEKGSGPLVLLLHGFPETWWTWRYQLDALAAAGFRVVAPDLRGYDENEKRGPYDPETLTADVRAWIEHLGEKRARVVGHDWGGAIAWQFAASHPSFCDRVTVINCPHPKLMVRALKKDPAQRKRSWYMFFFQLPWLPERYLRKPGGLAEMYRRMAPGSGHFGEEEIAPFVAALNRPGAATAAVNYYRALLRLVLTNATEHLPSRVEAPAMLVWGVNDLALGFDSLVPGTERYVPRLRVEKIETGGHFVHAEQPERVNPLLIDFLKS
jgi:pimeloyl-ACP methyl ester carboxylesterase